MASTEPGSASETVKQFLHHSIDVPNEQLARALLTAESLGGGTFHLPAELKGATYIIEEPVEEDGHLFIYVQVIAPPEAAAQAATLGMPGTLTVPFAPVQQGGQWKLDMNRTMQKMMGGMMSAAVGTMAQTMGKVMEGVTEAISGALGGDTPAPSVPAPVEPVVLEVFQSAVREIESELRDRLDLDLPLDIDTATLLTADNHDENLRLLDTLQNKALNQWSYWIREVHQKIPLQDRVKAIRLEGVASPEQRAIFSEGARIIYRLNLAGEEGYYQREQLADILAGVAAGMAESPPPSDVLHRGASYQPTGDGAQILANYSQFVLPVLTSRIAQLLGKDLTIQCDWDRFADDAGDAAGLWLWGVNRLCGAIGLLAAKEENRQPLEEGLQSVRLVCMTDPVHKSLEMHAGELAMFIAPARGETGCFYEHEIAETISKAIKLRLRPKIAELEKDARSWEESLLETFGRPIKFAVDWDTFASHPDENKWLFALSLLREHGIDRLYYAVTSLADKNPNFKQQFIQRIAWLYIESAPRPEDKMVDGDQTTIRYRCFLFEGYKGYLTQNELEARLPAIVAAMPDQDWDAPAPVAEPAAGPEHDDDEPHHSYGCPEPDDDETPAQTGAAQSTPFAQMQQQIESILPTFTQQIQQFLGDPIPIEIDWASLDSRVEAPGELLNASLTPVLGAIALLAQDPTLKNALGATIDKIRLQQSPTTPKAPFTLHRRILTYSTILPSDPLDPQTAADFLQSLLKPTKPKPTAKKSPAKKAAPKARKKASSAKPKGKKKK